MKIKEGDVVKAHDLSYSVLVGSDGSLKDYFDMHPGIRDSAFMQRTAYKVVSVGVKNLPSVHIAHYPGEQKFRNENNTIIQDVNTKEIIFIQSKFLYTFCSCCGQETKDE